MTALGGLGQVHHGALERGGAAVDKSVSSERLCGGRFVVGSGWVVIRDAGNFCFFHEMEVTLRDEGRRMVSQGL